MAAVDQHVRGFDHGLQVALEPSPDAVQAAFTGQVLPPQPLSENVDGPSALRLVATALTTMAPLPVCAVCSATPSSPPSSNVSRASLVLWLLESNPGCRLDACDVCAAWCRAVERVVNERFSSDSRCAPLDMCVHRSCIVSLVVHTCRAAALMGFRGHTARVRVDRVEEHSSDVAPSSSSLSDALREAQAEADIHADMPPGPTIDPPPRFDAAAILPPDFSPPPSGRATDDASWSDAEVRAVLKLLADDIVCGAVTSATPTRSSIIFMPAGVKPRVCIDLRPVNACLRPSSVRYPAARDLAAARKKWHVKLDLKAAFKSVGVPSCVENLLGFCVGGMSFVYTRLPFGWTWSPEIFTATLHAILEPLRVSLPECVIVAYVHFLCPRQHGHLHQKVSIIMIRSLKVLLPAVCACQVT